VLEKHSSQTHLFLKIVRQSWFRPIGRLIERITIPGILLHYSLRKKCINELVRSALHNGVTQVVVLGAGFDPLTSELQREFPAAEFWEIDHPATQRYKVSACSDLDIERVHFVPVDLSKTTFESEKLIRGGFDPVKQTFWVAEGLLMYFPANVVSALMQTLSSLSASGSQFAFTFMEKKQDQLRFDSQTKLVDWWLRIRGEPFLWGTTRNEIAEFIRPWQVLRFFDHNDLRNMGADLNGETLAIGEVICLAAV
jgi:methyltransferase (TIGR00027 family)